MIKQIIESKILGFSQHVKRIEELIEQGWFVINQSYDYVNNRSIIIYFKQPNEPL